MGNDSRTPLYIQIQQYFKERIRSKKLKMHERIPSEKSLMEQFGVSRITVANALAGLAKEGWIYRIPGRGSFVQKDNDKTKQALDSSVMEDQPIEVKSTAIGKASNQIVGLIMPTIDDFFAIRLIQGISRIINSSEYSLIVMLSNNSKEQEKVAIKQFIRMGANGLLIFPVDAEIYNDEILALKVKQYPFVLIDRYLPGIETHFISSNNVLGGQMAVSHLWENGHREIAICSDVPLPTVTVAERISGYMEELKSRGAMINPALTLMDFKIEYEDLQEDHLLYRHMGKQLATGYIALNGRVAMLLYHIARKIGLRIPEDVSIVSFDDPAPGYDVSGNFTHISQSEGQIGCEAAKMLLEIINSGNRQKNNQYQKMIVKPKLIIQASSGAWKSTHPIGNKKQKDSAV